MCPSPQPLPRLYLQPWRLSPLPKLPERSLVQARRRLSPPRLLHHLRWRVHGLRSLCVISFHLVFLYWGVFEQFRGHLIFVALVSYPLYLRYLYILSKIYCCIYFCVSYIPLYASKTIQQASRRLFHAWKVGCLEGLVCYPSTDKDQLWMFGDRACCKVTAGQSVAHSDRMDAYASSPILISATSRE
jgi:hypothetical protein